MHLEKEDGEAVEEHNCHVTHTEKRYQNVLQRLRLKLRSLMNDGGENATRELRGHRGIAILPLFVEQFFSLYIILQYDCCLICILSSSQQTLLNIHPSSVKSVETKLNSY
jgi:hypothetical protein